MMQECSKRAPLSRTGLNRVATALDETALAWQAAEGELGLWDCIRTQYDRAQRQDAATLTGTSTQLLRDDTTGIDFVLKISERLRDKPKPSQPR